jgi:hypothetical protein
MKKISGRKSQDQRLKKKTYLTPLLSEEKQYSPSTKNKGAVARK